MAVTCVDAERSTPSEPVTCTAEGAGYDGMFGVYCSLPHGHDGPHNDGSIEWDWVNPEFRNSTSPPYSDVKREVPSGF